MQILEGGEEFRTIEMQGHKVQTTYLTKTHSHRTRFHEWYCASQSGQSPRKRHFEGLPTRYRHTRSYASPFYSHVHRTRQRDRSAWWQGCVRPRSGVCATYVRSMTEWTRKRAGGEGRHTFERQKGKRRTRSSGGQTDHPACERSCPDHVN